MIIFSATLEGEPVAKGRPKFVVRGTFATAYTPKKTRDYETLVREWATLLYRNRPSEKALRVTVDAYFEKAKSNKKKYHTQKPDADNMKSILDALNGIVYKDDCQIIELKVNKHWATKRPNVTVLIEEIE